MAARARPHAPRLGEVRPASVAALLDDPDWYELRVSGDLAATRCPGLDVRRSHFVGAELTGSHLSGARLVDCVVEDSEFSGVHLDDAALTRVAFVRCRLSGVVFSAARWQDVTFTDCRLDGASLRMVRAEHSRFTECVLRGGDLYGMVLAHGAFTDCDLTEADFSAARVSDPDLRGSRLDGLRGIAGLQRPVLDPEQAVPFSAALMDLHGVVVRDRDAT